MIAGAAVREARYWREAGGGRIRCTLCPHECRLADGTVGACGVRVHHRGALYTLVGERVVARNVEPIEKKPLFHFYPGSRAYSIATVGCCLRCTFCQNAGISQWPIEHLPRRLGAAGGADSLAGLAARIPGEPLAPREIVADAVAAGAAAIAYTFVEPTVFFELALDTAQLARAAGLKNVFVTCGYTSPAPIRELARVMDAVNVDLKFFTEASYRRVSRGALAPVLDAIRAYHDLGVWTEVTTLVIPGVNDSDEELGGIARFLASVSPGIPWHVSRFFPAYRMLDRAPTPAATIARARWIGRETGLRYVYAGNLRDGTGENTDCPRCGRPLIERTGFAVTANAVRGGRCPSCGTAVEGVGMDGPAVS